nr:unnamed protein product [Spirometra erinaceieuropaei]
MRPWGPSTLLQAAWADHWWSVDTDDDGEWASPERRAEAHQAIVDALRQTGQSSYDAVPDSKSDARFPSVFLVSTGSEERVDGTNLLQFSLFEEPGLNECSDVHLVIRQFPCH